MLLSGSYYNGLSRTLSYRWLRPVGAWLLFTSFLYALAIFSTIISHTTEMNPDHIVARLVALIHIVIGVELLFSVIIEIYRPRIQSSEIKPLFESRLLAFFTAHDGILIT